MKNLRDKLRIFDRIAAGEHVHVLALGSSNTEHFMVGAHWFDYVNMGFMHTFSPRAWSLFAAVHWRIFLLTCK